MKRILTVVAATLALAAPAFAQAPDIKGTWDVNFNSSQGARQATMNILVEDGKLAAYINVAQMGEIAAWVTQKDSSVTMDATVQGQGGPIRILMTGTVDGNTMKGSVDFGGGTADWTAARTKPAPPAQGGQGGGSQEKPAPTMTGTWAFEVNHSAGTSTPTVTITQTDGKLSGKYQSTYGQFDLTGSIKGADFTFSVEVGTEQKVTLVYNGTLNGDAVKGSMTMGEMGEGTFTGKRK
jgi:hypothetical protein